MAPPGVCISKNICIKWIEKKDPFFDHSSLWSSKKFVYLNHLHLLHFSFVSKSINRIIYFDISNHTGQRPPPPPVLPPLIIREAPPKIPPTLGPQGKMINQKNIQTKKKKTLVF
jgi:hypothetical protein